MRVLMCPPDCFDVVDVKNPHMRGQHVDRDRARMQWDDLRGTFSRLGLTVELIEPTPGCEDMVFTANQVFTTRDEKCVLSNMRHPSRQREVPAFKEWFQDRGYEIVPANGLFEGSGDAIWHPGRSIIWMGFGFRSAPGALLPILDTDAEVIELQLVDERFYHLDTCFCALDTQTVLIHPPAFGDTAVIREHFRRVLEVDPQEAAFALACNAAAFQGRLHTDVVIDQRAGKTIAQLKGAGYRVHPVDTGEFLKSGGSVYCLHNRIA